MSWARRTPRGKGKAMHMTRSWSQQTGRGGPGLASLRHVSLVSGLPGAWAGLLDADEPLKISRPAGQDLRASRHGLGGKRDLSALGPLRGELNLSTSNLPI